MAYKRDSKPWYKKWEYWVIYVVVAGSLYLLAYYLFFHNSPTGHY